MLWNGLAARVDGKNFFFTSTVHKSETGWKQVSGMVWQSWRLSGTAYASSQSILSTGSGKPLLVPVVLTRPKHFFWWSNCTWAGFFTSVAFFCAHMMLFNNISHPRIEQDYHNPIPCPLCWNDCDPWALLLQGVWRTMCVTLSLDNTASASSLPSPSENRVP